MSISNNTLKNDRPQAMVFLGFGAIGQALMQRHLEKFPTIQAHLITSQALEIEQVQVHQVDYFDYTQLEQVAVSIGEHYQIVRLVICTGMLHEDSIRPEKTIKQLQAESMRRAFECNSILPAMVIKSFTPYFIRNQPLLISVLSARVGSISDNQLGGWYSYRAAKTALNMLIKNTSIEFQRMNKQSVVLGLHPGTVDSNLSKPFKKNVPANKLFSPQQSADYLFSVLQRANNNHTGQCLAWDGLVIPA